MNIQWLYFVVSILVCPLVFCGEGTVNFKERTSTILKKIALDGPAIFRYEEIQGSPKCKRSYDIKFERNTAHEIEMVILSANTECGGQSENILKEVNDRFPHVVISEENWAVQASIPKISNLNFNPIQHCLRAIFGKITDFEDIKVGESFRPIFMTPNLRMAEAGKLTQASDSEVMFEFFIPTGPLDRESEADVQARLKKEERVKWAKSQLDIDTDPKHIGAYKAIVDTANMSRNGYVGILKLDRHSGMLKDMKLKLSDGIFSHEIHLWTK